MISITGLIFLVKNTYLLQNSTAFFQKHTIKSEDTSDK